jgi:transposase
MWKPYLRVIRERCTNAVNILDRFHIIAKLNQALDDVRADEARRLARDGFPPLLKKTRWCVLKRKANLTSHQRFRLRDLLRYNLRTVRAYPITTTTLPRQISLFRMMAKCSSFIVIRTKTWSSQK